MKKHFNYFFIMAVLLVSAAVVSCEKEEDAHQGKYTMTVYATKSVNNSSKALSLDGTGLHATWTEGDVVKVYKGDTEVGSLTATSSGISTKLSGSITGSIAQSDNLTLKFLSPNYSSQNGTLAYIAANCDYAEADVTVASISGGNIRIEGASAEFVNKQSIVKFILKNSDGTATLGNPEYLQVSNNSGVDTVLLSNIPAATYSTNGAGIVFVAIPGFENKNVTVDAYLNGSRYSFTKNNITFADGKYYEIMVRMTYMNLVDLSKVKNDVTLQDGTTVIGTLGVNKKISIAADATVTLSGVSINANGSWQSDWAGITCEGDATIILKDGTTNTVRGFAEKYPGIFVPEGSTLTIQGETAGTGSLIASSNGWGAGIGGGDEITCGNIEIQGGTIIATGGNAAAGIGGGQYAFCGYISITGGDITAWGGIDAAGIGTGMGGRCGDITITNGVTKVKATKEGDAPNSIGIGYVGNCGTVTIGGVTGAITTSPYTYEPGVPLASSSVGYKVCSDGMAYATDKTLPSGVTVIGVVAYKSGSTGIVLYKQDNPDKYTWENRNIGNPSAVNVYVSNLSSTTSKSWTCGERDQYVYCGVDGTNWSNLQTRLNNAGCEELSTASGNLVYWTNTCPNDNDGWAFTYSSWTNYNKTNSFKVRPLFAF